MQKLVLTVCCCIILYSHLSGQQSKSIYIEGLGNAFLAASINYDMRLGSSNTGPGARIGFDLGGSKALPILANYIIGEGKHKVEVGAGVVIFTNQVNHAGVFAKGTRFTGNVSYRYIANSGFMARAGWTPISTNDSSSLTWFGLSVGWQF